MLVNILMLDWAVSKSISILLREAHLSYVNKLCQRCVVITYLFFNKKQKETVLLSNWQCVQGSEKSWIQLFVCTGTFFKIQPRIQK